jgi:membrane fusion protein (multidrug efflux system)
MKNKLRLSFVGIAILLFAVVVWKVAVKSATPDARRQTMPLVQVELPKQETVVYTLKFNGDVLPIQQANIFSKVTGNLEHIKADMGDRVRQNQLLALIDTTELAQQSRQTAATYNNSILGYQRSKELAERNLVAKQELDNAEAAMKVARANYELATTRLNYARITAPFSGYITRRYLDPGAVITANNSTLFTLMDLDAMKIIVSVLEKDIPVLKLDKKATVTVDAYPGREFFGTVRRFSEAVDLSTRTMPVQIDIPNTEQLIKPGMFATVTIVVDEHRNAITVPTQALVKDENGYFLFAVNDNIAHRKDVRLGIEQNGRTEILAGLTSGDTIISTGQQFVRDSVQVRIQ